MKTGEESDNYQLFTALRKRKNKLAKMKNTDSVWREDFSHMSQKAFANLQSRVTVWLEEWLVFYDASKNKFQQNVQLIEGYNKRGLYQLADQLYYKTLKQLERDESVEHDCTLTALHKAQYFSDNPIKHIKGAALLEDVVQSYARWHSKQASLYLAELHNWGDIQHVTFQEEKELYNQIISIEHLSPAYSHVVNLVREKEPNYLLQLISEIESNKIKEGTTTYIIILNYCLVYYLRLFNQGKINDPQLLLKLYNLGMNTGSFFSNGKIPIVRFHNIVNAISTFVTKEECDQFIQQWSKQVSTKDLESSRKVALAISCLSYEKYTEIIPLLNGITHEDLRLKVIANAILAIALHEEGDEYHDILVNHIFNYKRQLKRHQLKISHKLFYAYYNLCDFIEKISIQNKSSIKTIDLSEYSYLMFRSWAHRKLKSLQT
jgi:hypothetical protein